MDAKSIQEILDEQRQQSAISKTSEANINRTIANKATAENPIWLKNVRLEADKRSTDPKWSQQQQEVADKRFNGINGKQERKLQAERGRKSMSSDAFVQARENIREESKKIIITPFGKFNSYNDAQRNILVDLSKKIKQLPHLYYYEDIGPGDITYEKVYHSPCGSSNKRVDVYRFCKDAKMPSALENTHIANWWDKMCRFNPNKFYLTEEPKQEWALKGILRNVNKRK
jgi:hypothetical protein